MRKGQPVGRRGGLPRGGLVEAGLEGGASPRAVAIGVMSVASPFPLHPRAPPSAAGEHLPSLSLGAPHYRERCQYCTPPVPSPRVSRALRGEVALARAFAACARLSHAPSTPRSSHGCLGRHHLRFDRRTAVARLLLALEPHPRLRPVHSHTREQRTALARSSAPGPHHMTMHPDTGCSLMRHLPGGMAKRRKKRS